MPPALGKLQLTRSPKCDWGSGIGGARPPRAQRTAPGFGAGARRIAAGAAALPVPISEFGFEPIPKHARVKSDATHPERGIYAASAYA